MDTWLPIETAPKDKLILGLCKHSAAPIFEPNNKDILTTYTAHAEGLGHVIDGPHVLEWGGCYHEDVSGEGRGPFLEIPDWWFRYGSDFEEPAFPTHWMPISNPLI